MKGLQSSKIEREQRLRLSKMKELKREQRAGIPKPKRKQFKTIARILIFFLFSTSIGGFLSPRFAYAEALPDLPLEFDSNVTFADNVISFMAASGAAPTNMEILNDLYTNFGGSGYGVADIAGMYDIVDVNTGISLGMTENEIFSHLGDEDYFTSNGYDLKLKDYQDWKTKVDNSQSLAKFGVEFIHEATLHDTGNPFEWDWAEILKTYLKRGDIPFSFDIQKLDESTKITKTLSDVLNSVIEYFMPNIENSLPMDVDLSGYTIGNNYAVGKRIYGNSTIYTTYSSNGGIIVGYEVNDNGQGIHGVVFGNNTNGLISIGQRSGLHGDVTLNSSLAPNSETEMELSGWGTWQILCKLVFNNKRSAIDFVNGVLNGTNTMPSGESPDLINPNFSNLEGEELERMTPSIEQGKAIRPMPRSVYEGFANDANTNTENGDQPDNGPMLETLINPYINNDPSPNPNPDPDVNPRPVSPTQPDYPDAPDLTDEQIDESLEGITPELDDIFPFCIPWDIASIFTKFQATRQAPYFEFPIKSEMFGIDEVIVVDFSMFDDVAVILRYMELILFVIGLAIGTRKLIGA